MDVNSNCQVALQCTVNPHSLKLALWKLLQAYSQSIVLISEVKLPFAEAILVKLRYIIINSAFNNCFKLLLVVLCK